MLRLIARRLILPIASTVVLWIDRYWPADHDLYDLDDRFWPVDADDIELDLDSQVYDIDEPVDLWPADMAVPDDARELAP